MTEEDEQERDTSLDNAFLQLQKNVALLVRVEKDSGKKTTYRLKAPEINIGRIGDPNFTLTGDVVVSDPGVSRKHCRLVRISEGRYVVADCGSSNGTLVNGKFINEQGVMLAPDDIIRVGHAKFVFNPSRGWD